MSELSQVLERSMAVEKCLHYIMESPTWIFVAAVLTCTGIYVISRLFRRPRAGRNPFATDHREPRETIVTEPGKRDAVLKQSKYKPIKQIFLFSFLI